MINIGIVRFNSGNYGGIEHQIINVISKLNKDKFQFVLITNNKTQFSDIFERYGKVYYVKEHNIWKASKEVKIIVELEKITILQSHMLREHYIGCLTKLRKKNLYHIFRVHTYINCSFISGFKKKLYHILSFILNNQVDLYLPINKVNAEELMKYSKISKNKIQVIHDGVKQLESFLSERESKNNNIAMIANFNYGKGHDIALEALKILVDNNKQYRLNFIGYEKTPSLNGVSILETVKNKANELGIIQNIEFLGFVENVGKALQNIDIVILPSYSEGTPNCLLEAMSIKKIIVASKVGGVPEFVTDGVNGFLHDNKDYKTLAQKIMNIKKILPEKLEQIRQNGYETWKREYSLEALCNYFSLLYQEKG